MKIEIGKKYLVYNKYKYSVIEILEYYNFKTDDSVTFELVHKHADYICEINNKKEKELMELLISGEYKSDHFNNQSYTKFMSHDLDGIFVLSGFDHFEFSESSGFDIQNVDIYLKDEKEDSLIFKEKILDDPFSIQYEEDFEQLGTETIIGLPINVELIE